MESVTTIGQIDSLKRELDALKPLKPVYEERLWKKLRLEWNYNSNHIEGNTLTYGETELLLYFDKTTGDHTKREYDEMQAHDVAIAMVRELAADDERPLTESFIRKLNEVILVRPYWKEAITPDGQPTRREIKVGSYKSFPNSVRLKNGEMFHYATPEETPLKMQELMDWYNNNQHLHVAELAALFHYKFVRIHPFDDGNGRVARLLMNYVLMKGGLVPVIIKSKDKERYLTALNKADTGDINAFVDYILNQLPFTLNLYLKAAKGEDLEETDDIDKEIELLKRKVEANAKAVKTPKVVYNAYKLIESTVLPKFIDAVNSFSSVFTEAKTVRKVNRIMEEEYGTTASISVFNIAREISNKPREPKIFGYDIYETEIDEVAWLITQYGLKSINRVVNYETRLEVVFKANTYLISVVIDHKPVFTTEKQYGQFVEESELNDLVVSTKKFMNDSIQARLAEE